MTETIMGSEQPPATAEVMDNIFKFAVTAGGAWHAETDDDSDEDNGCRNSAQACGLDKMTIASSRSWRFRWKSEGVGVSTVPTRSTISCTQEALVDQEGYTSSDEPSFGVPSDRVFRARDLLGDMPSAELSSFQAMVSESKTAEGLEAVVRKYGMYLTDIPLPSAELDEVLDLEQVRKDTARERVLVDGGEVPFVWGSPADLPHRWYDELWVRLERNVVRALTRSLGHEFAPPPPPCSESSDSDTDSEGETDCSDRSVGADTEASEGERVASLTAVIFRAMSRTLAGGDAYFALVSLFCGSNKLVTPVQCREDPIKVDFHNLEVKPRASWPQKRKSAAPLPCYVIVTVPSTFDIYLHDPGAGPEAPAKPLARVRAVVEERIDLDAPESPTLDAPAWGDSAPLSPRVLRRVPSNSSKASYSSCAAQAPLHGRRLKISLVERSLVSDIVDALSFKMAIKRSGGRRRRRRLVTL